MILAFDTSGAGCSAALLGADGAVLARRAEPLARGHAERLMPMIAGLLGEAGLAPSGLACIAVTVGPGTFTGIRIGLAAAQGLALAAARPLYGISSFDAVAAAVPEEERAGRGLVVAIDSRRGDFFVQIQTKAGAAGEPLVLSPTSLPTALPLGELLLAGDGASAAAATLAAAGRSVALARHQGPPDAVDVCRIALALHRAGAPPAPAAPLYLRAPDVTLAARALPP
jgi:tRNA threonylcarbamoyladenosine biosynthesis protein TsaB